MVHGKHFRIFLQLLRCLLLALLRSALLWPRCHNRTTYRLLWLFESVKLSFHDWFLFILLTPLYALHFRTWSCFRWSTDSILKVCFLSCNKGAIFYCCIIFLILMISRLSWFWFYFRVAELHLGEHSCNSHGLIDVLLVDFFDWVSLWMCKHIILFIYLLSPRISTFERILMFLAWHRGWLFSRLNYIHWVDYVSWSHRNDLKFKYQSKMATHL